ncbi:cupin domain-containing protein [Gynuella sunshinyii]|uniref:Putative conserved protein, contains double-stranded beta-helix domain n=1 Tax=Gynuella sunshinyii YC6258 TaxID=1445510 RepID=A0A0C5VN11_9GAMM|nr:cupin domain-containing protein [Gynuella sunshinyii]AJQ95691.1 putative conserved protein, contains double-stranded beta-helix domain [Gynuella sunshinyii YC6258]
MITKTIRRIVTGHNKQGRSVISEDGAVPKTMDLEAVPGTRFHEVWSTLQTPARIDNGEDPTLGPVVLSPPEQGTRIRFVDIPPDTQEYLDNGLKNMKDMFAKVGETNASTADTNSPHPLMHRTESIDYGIVMDGEITLILDEDEVDLTQGDVVIQRGTNHAWANRSDRTCRMLFILVDGQFDETLA